MSARSPRRTPSEKGKAPSLRIGIRVLVLTVLLSFLGSAVSLVWLGVKDIDRIIDAETRITERKIPLMQTLLRLKATVYARRFELHRFVDSGDERTLGDLTGMAVDANEVRIMEHSGASTATRTALASKILRLTGEFEESARQVVQGREGKSGRIRRLARADRLGGDLESAIDGLLALNLERMQTLDRDIEAIGQVATKRLMALGLLWLGAGIVLSWVINRRLLIPVADLLRGATDIAAGHLEARVPVRGNDEIGDVAQSFNLMVAHVEGSFKRLKEASRLKDYFLSSISHEMKTPLSLIMGYSELLDDKYPEDELVTGIRAGVDRISEHLNDLLDYSALLSASLPLYQTDINIDELVDQLRGGVAECLGQKNIELSVDVERGTSGEAPALTGDPRRIRQMLLELLCNAAKFTPAGGRVGLRVASVDGDVRFEVWDTGPGLDPGDLRRIWEPFTQAAKVDVERRGGFGLGLAIVKELAALHGGRVGADSQAGHGSRFTVYLPARGLPARSNNGGRSEQQPLQPLNGAQIRDGQPPDHDEYSRR